MRVIAGTLGGRLLRGPKGLETRPITDRVKVNLFNILSDLVEDAVVADCFCGTGSMGIESLSRGARHVTFAEVEGSALRLLKENLAELGLLERSTILRHDVMRKGLPPPQGGAKSSRKFDLVFLDPPYLLTQRAGNQLWSKLLAAADGSYLTAGSLVIWRHDARVRLLVPPDAAARVAIADQRTYGSQTLTFIRVASGQLPVARDNPQALGPGN